jgi:hypothetical protein
MLIRVSWGRFRRRILTLSMLGILLSLTGCLTVNCPGCASGDSDCGAGGCPPPRRVVPGQTMAQGQVCNSGYVCQIENQPNCSLANPAAQCKSKNNGGVCSCKCE